MSMTHHYKSNLRDIYFNLFEMNGVQNYALGKGPYANMDEDTMKDILKTFEGVCQDDFARSFVESDRVPLQLTDEGDVILPEGLKQTMKSFFDGEWHRMELPEHLGGYGIPRSAYWGAYELMVGANPAATFYLFGNFVAMAIDGMGTETQKQRFVQPILDRHWGGTMVLTEPNAGSDVGAGRSKARHIEGDVYELEGVKRFITNGDFDGVENIVHLVLARPEGAGGGTKGLSLFVVPKYWVNEDGSLGERNGVFCTNIEKKMGLKGSATCEMTLGENMPCRGLLLGEVHSGIAQMFNVIEFARMAIGVKSASTLSTAYLNSLEYAKDRVQGPDMKNAMDKSSPRVSIINHPNVRRNLYQQKAYAEGLRALNLYVGSLQDKVALAEAAGDQELAEDLALRNDLLLPIVKGFGSEKVYQLLSDSLQVLGGSGYCMDYPHEQYIRDQKIDTLYEGTTHIQSLDLIFRKIVRDNGASLKTFLKDVELTISSEEGGEELAEARGALAKALHSLGSMFEGLLPKMMESVYHVGLHGNRILMALGETVVAWLLIRQAAVAATKLPDAVGADAHFYKGKITAARFFARERLPEVTLHQKVVSNSVLDLMELQEEDF
ncbi:MAG: acyl-CoA dehydrogenase [Myxococcales bacterium]|nr:acyl-CoA dehydrogenase [Myxococcales bacterium]|tara:strand:+ start:2315 stop:4138 length:1824 start_codon:yes stop_codon:yes gene_type:complete